MMALLAPGIFSRGVQKEVDAGRAHRILYEKLEKRRRGAFFLNAIQQMLSMSEFNLRDYIFIRASVARPIALKML